MWHMAEFCSLPLFEWTCNPSGISAEYPPSCSPQLVCAENFVHDSQHRSGTNLWMERVSRCVPFSQHLSVVQEYIVFLQFSSHQKYQAVGLDPHLRLRVDHQLKLLEPHFSRHHRCRRLLHPRHLPHSLQQSPSLCEVGIPLVRLMCK